MTERELVVNRLRHLWDRHRSMPFPRVGNGGDLLLWDTLLAGTVSSFLGTGHLSYGCLGVPGPSEETEAFALTLRQKEQPTGEQREFLYYYDALLELRDTLQEALHLSGGGVIDRSRIARELEEVSSIYDFDTLVRTMRYAIKHRPDWWTSTDLESFFEGLAEWLDSQTEPLTPKSELPNREASWRAFAEAILAAATRKEV